MNSGSLTAKAVFDVIRESVPADEKQTKDQDDGEKGERERDPFADREFPPAIVQPMRRAFARHSLGQSRRKGAQFLDHRGNNFERLFDLRLRVVAAERKPNAAARPFVIEFHGAKNVRRLQ